MLIRYFDAFENFTGANSHFLSSERKCKHPTRVENTLFRSPSCHLNLQTKGRSQSRIIRW